MLMTCGENDDDKSGFFGALVQAGADAEQLCVMQQTLVLKMFDNLRHMKLDDVFGLLPSFLPVQEFLRWGSVN